MKPNQHKPILELQRILIAVKMDQLMILVKEPIAFICALQMSLVLFINVEEMQPRKKARSTADHCERGFLSKRPTAVATRSRL